VVAEPELEEDAVDLHADARHGSPSAGSTHHRVGEPILGLEGWEGIRSEPSAPPRADSLRPRIGSRAVSLVTR
jgi:hypothetical protein